LLLTHPPPPPLLQLLRVVLQGGGGGGEVLLVRGPRNVHALYLALLQQPWCAAADQPDVPLLLAPVPFWGASLTQLHLKVC
jgi:hypothetical protein